MNKSPNLSFQRRKDNYASPFGKGGLMGIVDIRTAESKGNINNPGFSIVKDMIETEGK